ncbi:MAG: DUF3185 domain-containing protein [Candidatus Eisenbacteria bacterium]|nr:DUF3185 domain-containing protein [Candidatus Eisenbacteria bacterium]
MKTLGIVLVVAGVFALAYGGFTYNRERTVIDMGPLQATATEHHRVPISPAIGALALLSGVLLLVVPARKAA